MTKTQEEVRKFEFTETAEKELKRCLRYQNFASLLLLSVPSTTSLRGDSAVTGDRLLNLIKTAVRETDIIELQGEDLITVLLLYSDKRIARRVGERLKDWISNYVGGKGDSSSPQFYFGGACFPSHATDFGTLFQRAFQMVEKARSSGESLVQIYE
ncbi:MAG: diguanylate cyclase [Terriglobia bacterium]